MKQVRSLFSLLLLLLICSEMQAVTYVYFQNNTHFNFSYSTRQTGSHTMDPGEWSGAATGSIDAWTPNVNVMWTNRDQGVHNGMDFFFDVFLMSGNDSIDLKLKLHGNFVGSDLWQSLSGPGFSHAWFGDNIFHSQGFLFDGKQVTVKYTAEFTGGDDDVRFSIEESDPWPVPASDEHTFDVLAYNLYMLTPPTALTDQAERGAIIPNHILGYDALILSEVFYNDVRDSILVPGLSNNYPYHTAVVDAPQSPEDGGVMILSKWPILSSTYIVYDSCDGTDCFAAKGAMYAKIDKNGVPYHLIGTHTQAWQTGLLYRQAQFRQLRDFIDALALPANEAVLVGGDLNVDKILNNQNEYNTMFQLLRAEEPRYEGNAYTYDPDLSLYASGTDHEFLDYVLRLSDHLAPLDSLNQVRIYRSQHDDLWGKFDLSDHFSIWGHFVFPNNVTAIEPQEAAFAAMAVPNPFQSNTQILLDLPQIADVELYVDDLHGKRVFEETWSQLGIGKHRLGLKNEAEWPAGLYFYQVYANGELKVGRLLKQ